MYKKCKKFINTKNNIEFIEIVFDIFSNSTVKQMKNFRQHYDSSCLEHCLEVSYISYKVCKKLKLDYVAAARAGLLHDLFLYDWRNSRKELNLARYHAFIHPQIALENSLKLFDLTLKEEDIILTHMWPVTLFKIPKYTESFIITLVDKYSAFNSFRKFISFNIKNSNILKYAYIILSLFIIQI